jgi:glyoxylase-like metal-dependent hydrolase (beta-lactamase superfamily II)
VDDAPEAPRDPRAGWQLPAPGTLPVVDELDELVVRVLAPNPSPMTLDGTNTYVIGRPGTGEVVVLDPGPDDPEHLARVAAVVAGRDAEVRLVFVTHHHLDHAQGARRFATASGCTIAAATPGVAGVDGRIVVGGEALPLRDVALEVLATPGHTRDHLAVRLGTGAVLTGDHVLGRGTSVVAHPDGDLVAYLDSLRRLLDLRPAALYPGHGPALTEDPTAVLTYYQDHRRFRETQLLLVLAAGPATPAQLVARVYADVDRRLWPAAEASTRATLAALQTAGRVRSRADGSVERCSD